MKTLEGVITCVPTVFNDEQELDIEGFKENITYLEEVGMHGIIATHSLGEFYALDEKEFNKVASAARDASKRMLCIIGCAYQNVREIVRRANYADDIGADAVLIYPAHYMLGRCSDDDMYEIMRMVNDATHQIQLVQYDYPPEMKRGTQTAVGPDLIGRMLDFDRFKGFVTSVLRPHEGLREVSETCRRYKNKISILSVTEPGLQLIMSFGGKGCLAPYGLAMPKLLISFYEACKEDPMKSLELYHRITKFPFENELPGMLFPGKASKLFPGQVQILLSNWEVADRQATWLWPGNVKTFKAVIEAASRKAGPPRMPYGPPSPALRDFAKNWLADLGVL